MKIKFTAFLTIIILALSVCSCGFNKTPDESGTGSMVNDTSETSRGLQDESDSGGTAAKPLYILPESYHEYNIDIRLDTDSSILECSQVLKYVNMSGQALKSIVFTVTPNAVEGGSVIFSSVKCGSQSLEYDYYNNIKSQIEIILPTTLENNETTEISMNYTVKIPELPNRFGYQDGIYNLGNFYPVAAANVNGQWCAYDYYDKGDPFVTETSCYTVNIEVPSGYGVASTGIMTKSSETGGYASMTYEAEFVRDFAFSVSDRYDTVSGKAGDIPVTIYYARDFIVSSFYTDENSGFWDECRETVINEMLEAALDSIILYSDKYGEYPYPKLDIVVSGMTSGVGGMEYPMFVMVEMDNYLSALVDSKMPVRYIQDKDGKTVPYTVDVRTPKRSVMATVVHEIAHQWFYGLVGNDQVCSPWLDEGLCRYSEYLYFLICTEDGEYIDLYKNYMNNAKENIKSGSLPPVNTELPFFNEAPGKYGSSVYWGGGSLFLDMEQLIGSDKFFEGLKKYIKEYAYKLISEAEFIDYWNGFHDKESLETIFNIYLHKSS